MRRRQEWAKNPPAFVPTEVKPINESMPPEATPRRRSLYVDKDEISKHWDRMATAEAVEISDEPIAEGVDAPPEQKKRPGRPRKDKQAP